MIDELIFYKVWNMKMTSFDTSYKPYLASTVSKLAVKVRSGVGVVQACQPPPAQHRSCLPSSTILVFCSLVNTGNR